MQELPVNLYKMSRIASPDIVLTCNKISFVHKTLFLQVFRCFEMTREVMAVGS